MCFWNPQLSTWRCFLLVWSLFPGRGILSSFSSWLRAGGGCWGCGATTTWEPGGEGSWWDHCLCVVFGLLLLFRVWCFPSSWAGVFYLGPSMVESNQNINLLFSSEAGDGYCLTGDREVKLSNFWFRLPAHSQVFIPMPRLCVEWFLVLLITAVLRVLQYWLAAFCLFPLQPQTSAFFSLLSQLLPVFLLSIFQNSVDISPLLPFPPPFPLSIYTFNIPL